MRITFFMLLSLVMVATASLVGGCGDSPAAPMAAPAASTPAPGPTSKPSDRTADAPILGRPGTVASPVPDGYVRVVNTHCPVQTDHTIKRGMVTQEYAVEHRGRMIGMCCGDCVDYWKNLSDDERDELVAKVTAPLASNPPAPK